MPEKCADYMQALSNAQYEGFGGAIQNTPKNVLEREFQKQQDVLAVQRAEGEGMIAPQEQPVTSLTTGVEQQVSQQVQSETSRIPVIA